MVMSPQSHMISWSRNESPPQNHAISWSRNESWPMLTCTHPITWNCKSLLWGRLWCPKLTARLDHRFLFFFGWFLYNLFLYFCMFWPLAKCFVCNVNQLMWKQCKTQWNRENVISPSCISNGKKTFSPSQIAYQNSGYHILFVFVFK